MLAFSIFLLKFSQYPKMRSTKPIVSPCVGCPCQFSYIAEEVLALQHSFPLISSTGQVNYALSPQYLHAWPVVWKDASRAQLHLQVKMLWRSFRPASIVCRLSFRKNSALPNESAKHATNSLIEILARLKIRKTRVFKHNSVCHTQNHEIYGWIYDPVDIRSSGQKCPRRWSDKEEQVHVSRIKEGAAMHSGWEESHRQPRSQGAGRLVHPVSEVVHR